MNYLLGLRFRACRLFLRGIRRSENITTKIMIIRTPSPTSKPANCGTETNSPEYIPFEFLMSESANKIELNIIPGTEISLCLIPTRTNVFSVN